MTRKFIAAWLVVLAILPFTAPFASMSGPMVPLERGAVLSQSIPALAQTIQDDAATCDCSYRHKHATPEMATLGDSYVCVDPTGFLSAVLSSEPTPLARSSARSTILRV
jgi:hypothetical protein